MPFDGERPKPLILVGKNGSGKSTLISFIVNALVGLKQKVFENIEVEQGKVYRIRSPLGINGAASHYFAKLTFDKGVSLIEWQLDRPKQQFGTDVDMVSIDQSWRHIPANENSYYLLNFGDLAQPHILEEMLNNTSLLFFPADRFEPPDWLNLENLSTDLKLPDTERIKGRTPRRIFAKNRLKPTLEWLNSVIFDMLVFETVPSPVAAGKASAQIHGRVAIPGPVHAVFGSVCTILLGVLSQDPTDTLRLQISQRKARFISATVSRQGSAIRTIKDLMSLSAGESALFCLFASIVRDADLSSMQFQSPADISGIVIIDEADLHLHISLQYDTLPRLIALFPKIQFIISVHAPMVAIGLERVLGSDGFEIRQMPTGERIGTEGYAEFLTAFQVFSETQKFQSVLLAKINETVLPALLVEGKSDMMLLRVAWEKLHPGIPIPFEVVPCGVEADPDRRNGGAEMLRRCVEFLTIVNDRPTCALFDNDRAGFEQFNGLNAGFGHGLDDYHKKHKVKNAQAVLLPIPSGREAFVNAKKRCNSYLSMEHYFSDEILRDNGFTLDPIVNGSNVFEIDASAKAKVHFANAVESFEATAFCEFAIIFARLTEIGFMDDSHPD